MANDSVATRVHGIPEIGPRVEQSHAKSSGEEESRCGDSMAISRGFVESVHGTSGSGEIRVGVPARSGVRRKVDENRSTPKMKSPKIVRLPKRDP